MRLVPPTGPLRQHAGTRPSEPQLQSLTAFGGHTLDQRSNNRGLSAPRRFLYVFELQNARQDQPESGAVAVAALREPAPRASEAVLPIGKSPRLRTYVLEKQQLPAGAQHALDLPQHRIRVVDGA